MGAILAFMKYDVISPPYRLKRGLAFKGFHVKLLWGGCVDEKLTSSSAQIPEKKKAPEGSELKF